MKQINFERMIENRTTFDKRKKRLSLEAPSTLPNNLIGEHTECLILLNENNSKKVEDAIDNDFAYINYVKIVFEGIKAKNGGKFPLYDKKSIVAMVKIIDYENSTDVWVHCNDAFFKIVEFIVDPNYNFWTDLAKGNPDIVEKLMNFAIGKVLRKSRKTGNKEEKDAYFPSLASKTCKYLSEYVLGKDLYYINDKFVRKVLPFYCYYYLGKYATFEQNNYVKLFNHMKEVHQCIEKTDSLSKSQLDHIMWYCYKSSGDK